MPWIFRPTLVSAPVAMLAAVVLPLELPARLVAPATTVKLLPVATEVLPLRVLVPVLVWKVPVEL